MSQRNITYLSQRERYLIEIKLKLGKSIKVISEELNRHRSTIYREIKRNSPSPQSYESVNAENKYGERRFKKLSMQRGNRLLNKEKGLLDQIKELLRDNSPLVISKRFLKNKVSYGTIYNQIYYLSELGGKEYKLLYNKHRKRKKRGKNRGKRVNIPNRVSIHERPKIVQEQGRFGDFELDLICSQKGYFVSLIERKTKLFFLRKIAKKQSELVSETVIKMLLPYKEKVKTITTDNGMEFYKHEKIAEALKCKIYFCDPYSSWQKGMVENVNKLVRKYLPKGRGLAFNQLKEDTIKEIEDKINHYPRQVLNFKSAFEVLHRKNVALAF